jgi:hypothetical protein
MATFPGGTARIVDRTTYAAAVPPYIEYVIAVTPSDASQPFQVRVQANGTTTDLKAKAKTAIAAYIANLTPPTDSVPANPALTVAADGTVS